MWRKRRLRLAEAAAQRRSLQSTFGPYQETVKIALVHLDVEGEFDRVIDAIQATDAETKNDLADLDSDEEMTRRAFELLSSKPHNNYERALAALREDTRQWWAATLARDPLELMDDDEPATARGCTAFSNVRYSRGLLIGERRSSTEPSYVSKRSAKRSMLTSWSSLSVTKFI